MDQDTDALRHRALANAGPPEGRLKPVGVVDFPELQTRLAVHMLGPIECGLSTVIAADRFLASAVASKWHLGSTCAWNRFRQYPRPLQRHAGARC